ncbi:MAG: hypothetical protein LBL39_06860 [Planctomycetaceae bacterium]|jgi:TPR repeat protein|nr:hypothetical protein [Planctomycetaceae bacterium]
MTHLLFTVLLLSVSFTFAHEWQATSGHKLKGEFVGLKNDIVSIKLANGEIAEVPLDKLCAVDKEFVKQELDKNKNPFVIWENKPTPQVPPINEQKDKPKIGNDTPFEILKAEAEKDNPDALCWLGIAYIYGLNKCNVSQPKVNQMQYLKCFRKAAKFADSGNAAALYCRGMLILDEYSSKYSSKNSNLDLSKLSEAEREQFEKEYFNINKESIKWFRQAAEQNFAPAQAHFGYCLVKGIGIAENKTEGFALIRKAADQNFAPAQFSLSQNVDLDPNLNEKERKKESQKWCLKAAENGHVSAQCIWGYSKLWGNYGFDDEKNTNKDEAIEWFKKAAAQGDAESGEIVEQIKQIEAEEEAKKKQHGKTVKMETEQDEGSIVDNDSEISTQKPIVETPVIKQKQKRFEMLVAEAEKDNTDALCWLSIYYAGGLNVCPIDNAKISSLNQRAAKFANNGSAAAKFCQGICYFCGYGVKLNHEEAVNWFRKSAEQNFAPAQERLAMCLLLGDGVKEDKVEAIRLLQKSADQDFALAMYDFGFCYAMGNGVQKSMDEAVKWYRKAADKGLTTAQITMGHCYYKGISVKENKTEALAWYKKAASQGDKEADEIVKQIEKTEKDNTKPTTAKNGTENENQKEIIDVENKLEAANPNIQKYDWKTPLDELLAAAEKGNAEACLELNYRYSLGNGFCPVDVDKSNEWLQKGAKEDSPAGWVCLIKCYNAGIGEKIDETRALNLMTKISQSRYIQGQLFLALCYYQNDDSETQKEAFEIFHRLAEQGDAKAQVLLAACYLEGKGTAKDEKVAFDWTMKSAKQGFSSGQMILGAFYIEYKDIKRGVEWQIKAAKQGNVSAQLIVAADYLEGIGVKKNLEQAKMWAKKAIEQGAEEQGKSILQQIEKTEAADNKTHNTHVETKEAFVVYVKGHFEGISQDGKWLFHSGSNEIWGRRLSDRKSFYEQVIQYKVKDNNFLTFEGAKISTDEKYVQIGYSVAAGKKNEPLADIKHITVYATGKNAGKTANVRAKYLNNITVGKQKNGYTGEVYYQDVDRVITVEVDKDGTIFTVRVYENRKK